jgi:hypothetical protein
MGGNTKCIAPGSGSLLPLGENRLRCISELGVPSRQVINTPNGRVEATVDAAGNKRVRTQPVGADIFALIRAGLMGIGAGAFLDPGQAAAMDPALIDGVWNRRSWGGITTNFTKNTEKVLYSSSGGNFSDDDNMLILPMGDTIVQLTPQQTNEFTYLSSTWVPGYISVIKPGLDPRYVVKDSFGLYVGFNLSNDMFYALERVGQDSSGGRWVTFTSFDAPTGDPFGSDNCGVIAKANIDTGAFEAIWPRYLGYEITGVTIPIPYKRGNITFLFTSAGASYIAKADVFTDTWSFTSTQTLLGLSLCNDALSSFVSPRDDVIVGYVLSSDKYYLIRSTNGGTSWTTLSSYEATAPTVSKAYMGIGEVPLFGRNFMVSPKPGVVVMDVWYQAYGEPAAVRKRMVSEDDGATWQLKDALSLGNPLGDLQIDTAPYGIKDASDGTQGAMYYLRTRPDPTYSHGYDPSSPFSPKSTFPDAIVPVYLSIYTDYLCTGTPFLTKPIGFGNYFTPDKFSNPYRSSIVGAFGVKQPLWPGHPGRLEKP